jgi:hypothetical protein
MEVMPPTKMDRLIVFGALVTELRSPPGSRVCSLPMAPDQRLTGKRLSVAVDVAAAELEQMSAVCVPFEPIVDDGAAPAGDAPRNSMNSGARSKGKKIRAARRCRRSLLLLLALMLNTMRRISRQASRHPCPTCCSPG